MPKRLLSVAAMVAILVAMACSGQADPPAAAPGTTGTTGTTVAPALVVPTTTTTTLPRRFGAQMPQFGAAPPAEPIVASTPGAAPMLASIETSQPVAFLTIDDGYVRHPEALQLLREAGVPVSLFLVSGVVDEDPGFFADLQAAGATIQAHSIDHEIVKGRPYDVQRRQICGSADRLGELFGARPTLFRAPGGAYDRTSLQAAADCGMKAVLFWREAVNDGVLQFQRSDQAVHPGDIILMHFRQSYVEDFLAAVNGIAASGLTPARIEDYLG